MYTHTYAKYIYALITYAYTAKSIYKDTHPIIILQYIELSWSIIYHKLCADSKCYLWHFHSNALCSFILIDKPAHFLLSPSTETFFPLFFVSLTNSSSIHTFHVAPWDPQISDLTHALQGNPEMTRLLSSTYNSDILNLVSLLLFLLQTYIFGGLTFICIWMSYRSSCSLECNWIMPPSPKQLLLLWQVFQEIFLSPTMFP